MSLFVSIGSLCAPFATASPQTAGVTGSIVCKVADPSGAMVPRAEITLTHDSGASRDAQTTSDAAGRCRLAAAPGVYDLAVSAPGFSVTHREVAMRAGATLTVDLTLSIAVRAEEVAAALDDEAGGSAAAGASTLRLRDEDLRSLSDNDALFQQEITALAGGIGSRLPEVYVDGFSNSRFPPKTSIREVRFNRNKYSAQFDTYGFGRVEIFTKPGGDTLHGSFRLQGNDDAFNARNPFIGPQPPYHAVNSDNSLSGSLGKRTGFFLGVQYNDQQNNAAINAVNPDGSFLSASVPDPLTTTTASARLDHQFAANNFGNLRYEFNQATQRNGGLAVPLILPEAAYNTGTTTQTLQMADTQVLPPHTIMETRFQYVRTRLDQGAVSAAASTVVEGGFLGGGSALQTLKDNQDRFEFQEYVSREQGAHYLRLGGRYRSLRESNTATQNFNGQFIFPSLQNYQLTVNAPAGTDPRTNCVATAKGPVCGGASQFSVTTGQPAASIVTGDLGIFAEDEWRVRPNLTLTAGLRFESQSAVPDHFDPAPRVAATWALSRKTSKMPFVVLRAGSGIFYDRFEGRNLLTTVREDGVRQRPLIGANPGFYCTSLNACATQPAYQAFLTGTLPTVYQLNPNFKSAYGIVAGGSAEHAFGRIGSVAADFLAFHGVHQPLSRNANAPLPGTFTPGQTVYQFDSGGIQNFRILFLTGRLKPTKWLFAYFTYDLTHNEADAQGAQVFAAHPYQLGLDYGPHTDAKKHQLFTGGSVSLPLGISADYFFSAQSGAHFDITTGTDLNGDSIYNDRPSFATDLTRTSVMRTAYGNFDTQPQTGAAPIPFNYGHSPAFAFLELTLSRSFAVGPRPAAKLAAGPASGKAAPADRPWALAFSVDTANVFNRDNRGVPVGILSSPYFGHATTLNAPFTANTAANRTVFFETKFSF